MPLLKNVGIGIVMLLVFLMVVRPLLKMLGEKHPPAGATAALAAPGDDDEEHMDERAQVSVDAAHQAGALGVDDLDDLEGVPQLVGAASYSDKLRQLKQSINQDPKAVAAVIKQWTHSES